LEIKRKWKQIDEASIQFNIIKSVVKFIDRKKKRKRINMIENFFDAELKLVKDYGFHEFLNKSNLIDFFKITHNYA
jgi:hypothetical protein